MDLAAARSVHSPLRHVSPLEGEGKLERLSCGLLPIGAPPQDIPSAHPPPSSQAAESAFMRAELITVW